MVASPDYLKKKGKLIHPDDLVKHDIIFQLGSPYNEWHFLVDNKPQNFYS